MKLTWFGGSAFRLQIGGQVVVIDADLAQGIQQSELLSGADRVVVLSDDLPTIDGKTWRPRLAQRLLEAEGLRAVEFSSLAAGSIVIDADDDRPLVLVTAEVPGFGRWAGSAVMILAGSDLLARADALVAVAPRLIALAGTDAEVDATFAALRDRLDGTVLVALEPGLAVEA